MTRELAFQLTIFFIIIVVLLSTAVNGHVALTFPRARKYDLDFLDSARTPAPCGMPRGDVKTQLLAGSKFNITWHLAYPHNGGYKLQILDTLNRPLIDLTPVTQQSEFVQGDVTAQKYPVELPQNFTCTNCTVRLLREAEEWGSNYSFWSCADVDILDRKLYREDCSGHGRYLLGKCRCDRLYRGLRCELKDECFDDTDCGDQGVCVDNADMMTSTKYCYCNTGWYGSGCMKKSVVKSSEIDFDGYTKKRLSEDFIFYWRIIKDTSELEGVMVVNTTSWVAIGWRPTYLTPNCRAFPEIHDKSILDTSPHFVEQTSNSTWMKNLSRQVADKTKIESRFPMKIEELINISSESIAGESKSSAQRRSAKQIQTEISVTPRIDGDVTVQTSVTYKISAKHGRKRRSSETTTTITPPIGKSNSSAPNATFELVPKSKFTSQLKLGISSNDTIASISNFHPVSQPDSTSQSVFKIASHSPEWKFGVQQAFGPKSEFKSSGVEFTHIESGPESKPEITSVTHFDIPSSELKLESVVGSETNFYTKPISVLKSEPEQLMIESKPNVAPTLFDSIPNRVSTSESSLSLQNMDTEYSTKTGATKAPPRLAVHKYVPKHDFNPMDCTDMIIGMAKHNIHRIGDYYTRDRSTPQLDVFWGGKDSLTAATGFEKDGVTTIMFRKPLESNEPTDYNIIDTDMQVIWAKGQEPGSYNHQPPSGLENNKANIRNFYISDELKYHGHRSQRGVTILNFYDEQKREKSDGHASLFDKQCGGEWKYPRSCSIEDASCEYHIRWIYKPRNDQITFTIMTRNLDVWTGVGFSDNGRMTQTDAVLGWVDNTNGRPFVMDTWISGYNAPLLDPSQDIYNTSGKIENGVAFLTFSRKREAKDIKDLSFTDNHCLYMIFPVKGGIFNSVNKKIRKHAGIPIVSSDKICIKSCGFKQEDDEEVSTIAPTKFYIDIQVKLVNLGDGFIVPSLGSHDFNIISSRISDNFGPIMRNVPGYNAITLKELRGSNNGVFANMNLIVDRIENNEKTIKIRDILALIEETLRRALVTGKIGSLTVDPQHLVITSLHLNEMINNINDEDKKVDLNIIQLSAAKLYVIIGCFVALIALVLLQVSCTLFKTTKKSMKKQERLIANNGWKDYSTGAKTNLGFEGFETEEKTSSSSPPPPVPSLPRFQDSPDAVISRRGEIVNPTEKYRLTNQQMSSVPARATYSLPRAPGPRQQSPPPQLDYYTQDRRNNRTRGQNNSNSQVSAQQPDFYFMPSQRKYSGEVVRVYVDYGNQKSK